MVSPRSPCLSSKTAQTLSRPRRTLPDAITQHSTDDTEISSSSPEPSRTHIAPISIRPVGRDSTRTQMVERTDPDNHYFSPHQMTPREFRRKVHGIYVLPVSPTLSSSSSSLSHADEKHHHSSRTMPNRSFASRGVKNQSFDESPRPKGRTLPRSPHNGLKSIPPSQPPPDPPLFVAQQRKASTIDLDASALEFRFCRENIYGTAEDCLMKKSSAPPVPCRTQKPTVLPIGFEELKMHRENIAWRSTIESSPNDDSSEHVWPKPPESMTTSQISGILPSPSIPYDRLHHDHLIPTVLLRQQMMTNCVQLPRHGPNEHSMFTESDS